MFKKKTSKSDIHEESPESGEPVENVADKEVLDEEPRSILLGLISQLRKGMDLHRVTLPTFVLEPRSMLERITDFMSHPDLILKYNTHSVSDPIERFVRVVRYYISIWHIKPKGVKKPYNPVLGEFFRCRWKYEDGSESLYVAEQTSHHPPVSSYFYANPDHHLVITGNIRPKSKFLGNSAATIMNGTTSIYLTNFPNEEYLITMPNVYARGILFGTMVMEICDTAHITCKATGLSCEIDFKSKGFFSGTYNAIAGKIKKDNQVLYNLSGKWSDIVYISKVTGKTEGPKEDFFNALTAVIHPKIVAPEAEQEEVESRKYVLIFTLFTPRLWSKVTRSILSRNLDEATEEKMRIENEQREKAKAREEENVEYVPRFFHMRDKDEDFQFNHFSPKQPEARSAYNHLNELVFPAESPYKDMVRKHSKSDQ